MENLDVEKITKNIINNLEHQLHESQVLNSSEELGPLITMLIGEIVSGITQAIITPTEQCITNVNPVKRMLPALCWECKNPVFYIITPIDPRVGIPCKATVLMNGKMPSDGDSVNECPSCGSIVGFDLPNMFELL